MQRITRAIPGFVICFSEPFITDNGKMSVLIIPSFPQQLKSILRDPTSFSDTIHKTRYLVFKTRTVGYCNQYNQYLELIRLDSNDQPINDQLYFLRLGMLDLTHFPYVYLYGHADITLKYQSPPLFKEPLDETSRSVHWITETETRFRLSCSVDHQEKESTNDSQLRSAYIPAISIDRFHPH